MATEISKIVLKRGTTAKAVAYTGPVGEVVVDTDLRTLRVQDNVTPGGVLLSKDGHAHGIADVTGLQSALDSKGSTVSPSFTGTPTAPTAVVGTNTTQIATTAFVAAALSSGPGTAAKLATARTIALTGDVAGSGSFDGSANLSIDVQVSDDSHQHTFANLKSLPTTLVGYGITDAQPLDADLTAVAGLSGIGIVARTGNGTAAVRSLGVSGTGLSISNADGVAGNPTIAINATNSNTSGAVVARDASGNFAASTITAALAGNADTATKLATARTLSVSGDATGSATFDGSANAAIAVKLANSGVAGGTYKSVTVDAKGRVTAGSNPTTLAGYGITDAQPLDADLTAIAALAVPGLVARTGNGTAAARTLSASGTGITVTNGDGAAGNPTVVSNATNANTAGTIVARDASGNFSAGTISAALSGNASTATALQTARTISLSGDSTGSVSFDGTTNAQINVTLANSGVGAGTYRSVTVDAKGRVTAGTNPTTLAGYGITDAASLNSPALSGTPTAPTAAAGTNTTQIATTAFVAAALASIDGGTF